MEGTQILGLVAGVFTASSMLPQVVKTIKEKKADEVSLVMLFVLLTGVILWVVYGIKKDDFPIIATNCFSMLVNMVMIGLRLKYKNG
jgi:MtN3 and saliva related transmembrane protein